MEQPLPVVEPPAPAAPRAPSHSLASRLMNVFAVPGEIFEDVKAARPSVANWLVPILLSCLVGVIGVSIVFGQPAIRQKVMEKQQQAMEKKFDQMVEAGKMTREQADKQIAGMEQFFGSTMLIVFGSFGVVFYSFIRIFFWALLMWLVGMWFFKVRFSYLKAAEVVGLASMIGVLGLIVKTLLQVNFSNPAASPSLALMVGEFDERNLGHMLLAMVDLFRLWEVGVVAVGLGRLAGVPFTRAAFPMFLLWALMSLALGGVGAMAAKLGG